MPLLFFFLSDGYVPSAYRERSRVFFFLFSLSFCNVVMKVVSSALLATVGSAYLLGLLAIDMALYLMIKAARDDLRYWIRHKSNAVSWAISVLARVVVKTVADVTMNVHFRRKFQTNAKSKNLFGETHPPHPPSSSLASLRRPSQIPTSSDNWHSP